MTRKEINLIIALLEAQKESISFLRGFRKPNAEEQRDKIFYNELIEKVRRLEIT